MRDIILGNLLPFHTLPFHYENESKTNPQILIGNRFRADGNRNAPLFIILSVRSNIERSCSQFWLSVRNSV